jgi:hypothetical protein
MRSAILPVLLVLAAGLIAPAIARSDENDAQRWAMQGNQMSAEDRASLEEQVAKDPENVAARTKLLGYYFSKGRSDAPAKSAQQGHVLWLIENAPESGVLGLPYG